jgi:hydroxymethylpyrimidine/phosphomethylpyrimidine kinase
MSDGARAGGNCCAVGACRFARGRPCRFTTQRRSAARSRRTPERLSAARVGTNLRGSGCALASAIAAYLAQGVPLPAACARAKNYVTALLQRS